MKSIILASASPRRKELLANLGLEFTVIPADIKEDFNATIKPHELAQELSQEKAKAVTGKVKNALVIAADTFIIYRGKIMGKPHTTAEAYDMLQTLNGKSHKVITGFTIIDTENGKSISRSVETKVFMKKLTSAEINNYVMSGEPLDKAGAYAIQGLGATIIEKITGDYFNIVGLPLSALAESLREFGIHIL